MGSSTSRINDMLNEKAWLEDKEWLKEEGKKIKILNPSTSEFRDFKWLKQNQAKILRNRRLIELLG